MDKWLEALEEIKRLNAEIIRVKDEQIMLLKEMGRKMESSDRWESL